MSGKQGETGKVLSPQEQLEAIEACIRWAKGSPALEQSLATALWSAALPVLGRWLATKHHVHEGGEGHLADHLMHQLRDGAVLDHRGFPRPHPGRPRDPLKSMIVDVVRAQDDDEAEWTLHLHLVERFPEAAKRLGSYGCRELLAELRFSAAGKWKRTAQLLSRAGFPAPGGHKHPAAAAKLLAEWAGEARKPQAKA